jgi:ketosteroid isomerase-like protein
MFVKAPESFYPIRNNPPDENLEESASGGGDLMKLARAVMIVAVFCSMAVAGTGAQTKGTATAEVTALLREFVAGAGSGDRAIFEKFFADDVIYTRATGVVITKADIMQSLGKPSPASEGKSTYSAEDITVHEYGDTAIVAFRLEGHTEHADGKVL